MGQRESMNLGIHKNIQKRLIFKYPANKKKLGVPKRGLPPKHPCHDYSLRKASMVMTGDPP